MTAQNFSTDARSAVELYSGFFEIVEQTVICLFESGHKNGTSLQWLKSLYNGGCYKHVDMKATGYMRIKVRRKGVGDAQ